MSWLRGILHSSVKRLIKQASAITMAFLRRLDDAKTSASRDVKPSAVVVDVFKGQRSVVTSILKEWRNNQRKLQEQQMAEGKEDEFTPPPCPKHSSERSMDFVFKGKEYQEEPDSWTRYIDESGWPYYYNHATGESHWAAPEEAAALAAEYAGDTGQYEYGETSAPDLSTPDLHEYHHQHGHEGSIGNINGSSSSRKGGGTGHDHCMTAADEKVSYSKKYTSMDETGGDDDDENEDGEDTIFDRCSEYLFDIFESNLTPEYQRINDIQELAIQSFLSSSDLDARPDHKQVYEYSFAQDTFHRQFQKVFESLIEEFLEAEGVTPTDFVATLKTVLADASTKKGKKKVANEIIDCINWYSSFGSWAASMREEARYRKRCDEAVVPVVTIANMKTAGVKSHRIDHK